jgi:ethanolamine utilization protein EutJ
VTFTKDDVTHFPLTLPADSLEEYIDQAGRVILHRDRSAVAQPLQDFPKGPLKVGIDLGTAYLVLVVLDEFGTPLAGEWQFAQVARDGLIVDFFGASELLKGMKERV